MEYLTIIITLIFFLMLIKTIYQININEIKKIGDNNKELDNIVKKYPSNIRIWKKILKKLNNKKVNIQEDKNANNCLYIAVSDKIIIANMRESFTRIQTIAHECLHSVQDRRILLFNFIYSIFYLLYFYVIAILAIFKILPQKNLFITIYLILSYIYYFVRSYLENEAMIKARFLAKEYMEEAEISNKKEIEKIVNEYDKLNKIGIKTVNYKLFSTTIIKTIILALIFLIRWGVWFFIQMHI